MDSSNNKKEDLKQELSNEYTEILEYIFNNGKINYTDLVENLKNKFGQEVIIANLSLMKDNGDVIIKQIENNREIEAVRNQEGLTAEEIKNKENIKKWGNGYTQEDFDFLNQKFDEYKQSFNIRNPQTNNDIITICQLELILKDLLLRQRNKEDVISEIQKIKKTINETANLAKLSESKRTADDYGIDSLSKIISIVEKDLIEEGNWIDAFDIVNNELQVKKDDYDLLLDNYHLNEWNGN